MALRSKGTSGRKPFAGTSVTVRAPVIEHAKASAAAGSKQKSPGDLDVSGIASKGGERPEKAGDLTGAQQDRWQFARKGSEQCRDDDEAATTDH